ncbi:hypothetical protein FPZ12_013940 [Amycolatopsis acidicola]|uniref:Uncharacterized protein n=1 Tax=Amycolatopsis acidicola TaxID=2596893 RepID=A0A5N0V6G5_9PSEU|nr:hypothetical protein [Amycolatopsis acidicola]KAA9161605.1 hypothetical protein FPZ12_013940 [Amycolatopsis acidicola]
MSTTTGTLRMRFTTEDLLTPRARLSHDLDPGEFGWPATPYTRALGEGDREAMNVLVHAIESYYHAVIEPRWPLIQRTAAAGHDSVHRRMGEAGHVLGRTRTMILVRRTTPAPPPVSLTRWACRLPRPASKWACCAGRGSC